MENKNILDVNLLPKGYHPMTLRILLWEWTYELKGTDLIMLSAVGFLLFFGFMGFIAFLNFMNLNTFFNFIFFISTLALIVLYICEKNKHGNIN